MGLSSDQVYKRKYDCKAIISDIFSCAKSFLSPQATILKRRQERLFENPRYKSLPSHAKGYLEGYMDAKFEEIYRYQLEWRLYTPAHPDFHPSGPALLSKDEIKKLIALGWTDIYQAINAANPIDSRLSTHTYIGRPDRPY